MVHPFDLQRKERSQPTYEELKQEGQEVEIKCVLCSQPTYEELKQSVLNILIIGFICSQPTYEELKLQNEA